jgi:adenylate cyclase
VIHRRVPIEKIRNTLVIVGSTALSLGDRIATPEGNQTPGLEIHAQILSALLDGEAITSMDLKGNGFFWLVGVGIIGFCGFLVVFWPKQSSLSVLGFCVALSLFYFLICYWVLRQFHVLLPMTIIPIFLLLSGFFGLLADVVRNNQKLARIAKQSSYFLPSMLVKRLLNDQELSAETESKQLTVLVADMRGFTHASEGKSPAHVAKLAQKCLEVLSEIVVRHGGVIEKYTGDGLMAIWGVGENKMSHAQGALNAGLAMQSEILNLSGWFKNEGFEPMRVSVGINSGDMAVGIYGNAHRAWSAHGDEVNLATRIEQLTRTVGRDLLMGELTAQLVGIDQMECFGLYSVKGREHPVKVYGLKIQDVQFEK